jgi:hypothetical protein
MGTSFRWAFRFLAAAAVLAAGAADSHAQVVIHGRPGQPRVEAKNPFAPVRLPGTQPFRTPQPNGTRPSAFTMPTVGSSSAFPANPYWHPPADTPWTGPPVIIIVRPVVVVNRVVNPFLPTPEADDPPGPEAKPVVRRARDPFVANPLLMNPLLAHRAVHNPFNGPGFITGWGLNLAALQRGGGAAAAARPAGSLLDQPAETPATPAAPTVYQPVSGVVTLADGSTFYRGSGTEPATAIGNYSGGNFDAELIGGSFFSPAAGFVGKLEPTVFLPYVW